MRIFLSYSSYSRSEKLVESLKAHLKERGHHVLFAPEEAAGGRNQLSQISAGICSADVLVAVATTASPNVFYELGLAHGASVPALITARAGDLVPSDLTSVPYVQLTGDALRDAQTIVRRAEHLEGLAATKATSFNSVEAKLRAAGEDPALLESLSPNEFEESIFKLFKERGYDPVPGSPGTGHVDLLLTEGKKVVVVELKKLSRQSRVSVETVRQVRSAMELLGAAAGIIVSTSGFTAAASALAADISVELRTLEDVLATKSVSELLGSNRPKDAMNTASRTD